MPGVRLEWDGKTAQVPRLRLPLQVVETVNAPRADRGTLTYARDPGDGWRNKLIWGDNLFRCSPAWSSSRAPLMISSATTPGTTQRRSDSR